MSKKKNMVKKVVNLPEACVLVDEAAADVLLVDPGPGAVVQLEQDARRVVQRFDDAFAYIKPD